MAYVFKGKDIHGIEHTFIVYEQSYTLAYKKLSYELVRNSVVLTNLWRVVNDETHVHVIS